MSLSRIRGHGWALRRLRDALASGRMPHALLLSGPEGVGKRQVALEVAKAVNCAGQVPTAAPERTGGDACDVCPSCRLAERGAHPDILAVAPEGRWVKIAQVREVERHVALRPYAGRRRVAILDGAETMTLEAANAFLKTLEEPPGAGILTLVSAAPTSLLPTIRSRCQEVRFGPLPDDEVMALLVQAGLEPGEARRAAALGAGSVGQARLWAERFPLEKADRVLERTWASLASPGRALAWAQELSEELKPRRDRERDLAPWVFLLLGTWARELAVEAHRPEPAGGEDGGRPGQGQVSLAAALAFYDAVAAAQEALNYNANLRLALEAMLLRMRAALGGR